MSVFPPAGARLVLDLPLVLVHVLPRSLDFLRRLRAPSRQRLADDDYWPPRRRHRDAACRCYKAVVALECAPSVAIRFVDDLTCLIVSVLEFLETPGGR